MNHHFVVMCVLGLALSVGACSDDAPGEPTQEDNPPEETPDVIEPEPDVAPMDAPQVDPEPDIAPDEPEEDTPSPEPPPEDISEEEEEEVPVPDDTDRDGVPDDEDAFPFDPTEDTDTDMDGVGDNADLFPEDPNESVDTDLDGIGDNSDEDDDNDGISDLEEMESGEDCLRSNPQVADTDGDEIEDGADPYPRDPWPEFLLRANDVGSIDLFLSNRDGSFEAAVQIGESIFNDQQQPLNYGAFSIGDFNDDGKMDFVAHSSPLVEGQPTRRFYFFFRDEKADEFTQVYIGDTDLVVAGTLMDANADERFDVVTFSTVRNGNIVSGHFETFLGHYDGTSTCVHSTHAEDDCFFVRLEPHDVTAQVGGQWKALRARQAVNLNPLDDGFPDLTMVTYSNGGNAATTIYTLFGRGDGTFESPQVGFVHNANRSQAPANTVIFADFNGDDIGDVLVGFDDDGRPGESWTYFGDGQGAFDTTPVMGLDINPNDARETPTMREFLGREGSGRTFDFDFDGHSDMVIGVHHTAYDAPGQTRLYRGLGDGTFDATFTTIGPDTRFSGSFELPQRLCPTFDFGD